MITNEDAPPDMYMYPFNDHTWYNAYILQKRTRVKIIDRSKCILFDICKLFSCEYFKYITRFASNLDFS